MSVKNMLLSVTALAVMVGCSSVKTIQAKVSVMKQEGGRFIAVASSSEEAIAYDGAKVRAEEQCFKENKDFVVVSEEAKYQGADQTAKGIASAVTSLFGKGGSSKNLDDYRVKMVFKCDGSYTGQGAPFSKTLDLSTHYSY